MPYSINAARPVGRPGRQERGHIASIDFRGWLALIVVGLVLALTAAGWISRVDATNAVGMSGSPARAGALPVSWLRHASILAVYGRAFNTAPVLGRLGMAGSFAALQHQTAPARGTIRALSGGSTVHMAVHLIYGMAAPCTDPADNCLMYLDDAGVDVVRDYIEPAARRGWLVILDDQLGRSTPVREIERMREKGYLAHDNVEVAFDPEFRTAADQLTPGSPRGGVTAEEINDAERAVQAAVAGHGLRHRKLVLVHQWTPQMVTDRADLLTQLKGVQPVLVMDGIGPADEKVEAYNALMSGDTMPAGVTPGIKLFLPNPYAASAASDLPTLSWPQILGRAPVMSSTGSEATIRPVPRIIIIS